MKMFSSPRERLFRPDVHRVLFGVALLIAPFAIAATPAKWERRAPLPVGNGGFISANLDDQIVIAGGTTWKGETKIWLDQIWAYEPRRNRWREVGRLSAPLAYGVAGQAGATLWFASGSSGATTHRALWKMEIGFSPQLVAPLVARHRV